jgi:hypothetical protein
MTVVNNDEDGSKQQGRQLRTTGMTVLDNEDDNFVLEDDSCGQRAKQFLTTKTTVPNNEDDSS